MYMSFLCVFITPNNLYFEPLTIDVKVTRDSTVPLIETISSSICGKTMKNNDSKFNQKPVPLIDMSL